MSGTILARVSAISLAMLLAACGGDDSSSPLAGTGNGENSVEGSTGGNGQTISLELGTGSGSGFQSGRMTTSATNLSSGGSTRLEFNVVNAAAGNSIYNTEVTSVTLS